MPATTRLCSVLLHVVMNIFRTLRLSKLPYPQTHIGVLLLFVKYRSGILLNMGSKVDRVICKQPFTFLLFVFD